MPNIRTTQMVLIIVSLMTVGTATAQNNSSGNLQGTPSKNGTIQEQRDNRAERRDQFRDNRSEHRDQRRDNRAERRGDNRNHRAQLQAQRGSAGRTQRARR